MSLLAVTKHLWLVLPDLQDNRLPWLSPDSRNRLPVETSYTTYVKKTCKRLPGLQSNFSWGPPLVETLLFKLSIARVLQF